MYILYMAFAAMLLTPVHFALASRTFRGAAQGGKSGAARFLNSGDVLLPGIPLFSVPEKQIFALDAQGGANAANAGAAYLRAFALSLFFLMKYSG